MGKALGLLLLLAGTALGLGAVVAAAPALAPTFGPWAGHPALVAGGAGLLLLGALLLARPAAPGGPWAAGEALLVLAVASAGGLVAAVVFGVSRRWAPETLAALGLGAIVEVAVAIGLAARVATARERRKVLFLPGLGGAALVGLALLLVLALGA